MPPDTCRLAATLSRHVHLGTAADGNDVFISLDELKRTSCHVVGASGYGKSYFLRNLIRHFLRYGQPFGLVDPHRDLFEYAVGAIQRSSVPRDKVVILDPGASDFSAAFNPLACGVADPGEASSLVLEAVLKAWGASSFDQTPRLEGLLRSTFRLLVDNQLTLLEAPDILNIDNGPLRETLRERVSDPWVRQDWEAFEKVPRVEKIALIESSQNRLRRFLQSDAIRRMLGQRHHSLDLPRLMDSGGILLANVGNTNAPETGRLLGALIVNAIYHAAKQRGTKNRKHFFLIVDECGQFATADIANSLDELRKNKCSLVLGHQRLRQLEREDSEVLSAVMTNAKIKVVFGGLERPEAERMAKELFTGAVDGDGVKHVGIQTKFRPVFDTFEVETETWSDSDSTSESSSETESDSESEGSSTADSYLVDQNLDTLDDDDIRQRVIGGSFSRSTSRSTNQSSSSASSSSRGGSRSLVPITRHEMFREETSRTFYSLEEAWEKRIAAVHQLGKREAFVKVHNGAVLHIRTVDVPRVADDRGVAKFKTQLLMRNPHVQPAVDVQQEIDERRRTMVALTEGTAERRRPLNIRSFRE